MNQFLQTTSLWRHEAFPAVVIALLVGCATTKNNTDEPTEIEPAPIHATTTQHEDDAVVALYNEQDSVDLASIKISKTKSVSDSVQKGQEIEATGMKPTNEKPNDSLVSDDQPRRTSMPNRDQKKKGSTRVGGIRKAVAVDVAASELFGKWKIDQEKSSADFLRADAILFLTDGRMRIWRDNSVEDGRWSWNNSDGLKTGGLDGVPFSLGTFEVVDRTIVITSIDDKIVVLIPDRIFIAPTRVLAAPNISEKVQ